MTKVPPPTCRQGADLRKLPVLFGKRMLVRVVDGADEA